MSELSEAKTNVVFESFGEPEDPLIIFFSGWGLPVEDYSEQLVAITELGFQVLALETPGFGQAQPLPLAENTVSRLAELFGHALEEVVESPAIFMGHSTGGGIASLIAQDHPHLTNRIILLSPVGNPESLSSYLPRLIKEVVNIPQQEVLEQVRRYPRTVIRIPTNLRLGMDAKRLDLGPVLDGLTQNGIPVHLFVDPSDAVAPPGHLMALDRLVVHPVSGGHDWFRLDPMPLLSLLPLWRTDLVVTPRKRRSWLRTLFGVPSAK